jgi:hypothetical protein
VFITIQVTNVTDQKIELLPEGVLKFTGKGGPKKEEFAVDLALFGEIDIADCTQVVSELKLFFSLKKKEEAWWPRLLKEKTREHWLKIDFAKWRDEDPDSEDEAKPDNYNGMPGMEGMGGGGGMPGMGGPGGGGMEGFDMEAMMKQMGGGGAGGAGGAGGMPDMASMMAQMGGMGGAGGPPPGGAPPADADDEPDSDDEDMPGLE